MVLRFATLLLSALLLRGGMLDFFFQYPFLGFSPSVLYPADGRGEFFLNGRAVPPPLFHITPSLLPFPYRMDRAGKFWSLSREKREFAVGSRGDVSLRWLKENWGVTVDTFGRERGRFFRLTGFKEGKGGLFYWDGGRRKGVFTGRWEDWFVLSWSRTRGGIYARGFRLEGTGGFSGLNLGGWLRREGFLKGLFFWEVRGSFDAFYGVEEGYSRTFKLGNEPFLKVEVEDARYLPLSLEVDGGVKGKWEGLDAGLGFQLGFLQTSPWIHPYGYVFLRRSRLSFFMSLKGILPPVEGLRGLGRRGGLRRLYTWDGAWAHSSSLQPPAWKGKVRPFTRLKMSLLLGTPTSLFGGFYFLRDWRLPEDRGLWGEQEEMRVYFGEATFPVWFSRDFQGYLYGNFSSLWRQSGGVFAGAGFRWRSLGGYLRLSYDYSRGTYPLVPLSPRPGEIFLYSTEVLNDRNWEPSFRREMEGALPQSNGPSLLSYVSWNPWRLRVQGFVFLFPNFPSLEFIQVAGLSQAQEVILVSRGEGDYNAMGALRISYDLPWGGVLLEAHGVMKNSLWRTRIDGQERDLLSLPAWRVFLGVFLR